MPVHGVTQYISPCSTHCSLAEPSLTSKRTHPNLRSDNKLQERCYMLSWWWSETQVNSDNLFFATLPAKHLSVRAASSFEVMPHNIITIYNTRLSNDWRQKTSNKQSPNSSSLRYLPHSFIPIQSLLVAILLGIRTKGQPPDERPQMIDWFIELRFNVPLDTQ